MSENDYVTTQADHRRMALGLAVQHLKGVGSIDDVIAAGEKFHSFTHSGGTPSDAPKPAATRTRKPAAEAKPAAEKPVEAAAVVDTADGDILGDEGDGFLTEDEPAAAAAPAAKKLTIDDVRAALLALQQRTDAKTARTVLSKNADGADTLGKIKPEKFQAVITAATAQKDKIA